MGPQPEKKHSALEFIGRAFRYRNYRLFFGGQGVSLIGTWMQQIAMSWLVYRLTDSAFYLGLIGFTGQVPILFLSSFAGVLADRIHRRNLLIATQILSALQASILAILTLTGLVQVWHLVTLSLFLGCVNAFDIPTRQSFVIQMIEEKKDLGNAIALNSFMFNGARLVGPSIAGLVIVAIGEGLCFLVNALSFLAIIATLLAMRVPKRETEAETVSVFHGLKQGYRYALGFPPIRFVLFLIAVVSFVGMPYIVLMPIFARDVLHGGPHTLGFLMGASGVGAVIGALYLASRKSVLGLGRLIVVASVCFGTGLILFSFSSSFLFSLVMLLLTGFGMIVQMAAANTLIQTVVDEDKRGRIMSMYAMAWGGTAPFGNIVAGSLAARFGAPETLAVSGLICIIGGLLFFRKLPLIRQATHPVYIKLGIIPRSS
ncbi:MAG TPA: MFS transporter [Oculatellaceae cyanobacterium]|nr:MFS transporter [Syntrophorhabdaceae bacterium]